MNKSTTVILPIEEADAEIELSAQELFCLSDVRREEQRDNSPTPEPARLSKSAAPRRLGLPLALSAAIGVVGMLYVLTKSDDASHSTAATSEQMVRAEGPAPQQLAEGEAVRFTNPFDADEVFEFPAGTSESQARDAVADVLLKRAMSRQKT